MKEIKVLHVGAHEELFMNYYKKFSLNKIRFDFVLRKGGVDFQFKNEIVFDGKLYYITPLQTSKFKFILDLRKVLKSENYDYIHFHIGYSAFFGILACLFLKIKIISHNHTFYKTNNIVTFFGRQLSKILINIKSNYKFACSKSSGDEMFFSKYLILPNAIDYNKFFFSDINRRRLKKELNFSDFDTVLGHVGNFYEPKNHLFLVSFFKEFKKRQPRSKLILIGDDYGTMKDVTTFIELHHLKDDIIILGPRKNVYELLNILDFFIFPSKHEGFGMALLEAQVNGLPCLFSDSIPRDSIISDFTVSANLNEAEEGWVNYLSLLSNNFLLDSQSRLQRSSSVRFDYDVNKVSSFLENFYINNTRCVQ